MKLMHTTTTTLNTKEFNKVSDNIIRALYSLSPEIRELYDIHINYIEDDWQIDFLPTINDIPAIKAVGYTEYTDNGVETLRINPQVLSDFPTELSLKDNRNTSYDLCMNYVAVFEFILSLYDFEYKL